MTTSASMALAAIGAGAVTTLGLTVAAAPPAAAAPCSAATGVTAVVDFNQLGGGVTAGCAPDGHGDVALRVFDEAGYTQESHPEMGNFVCRIDGRPAAGQPCAQEDAFWSLWWSDGQSGEWVFSQQGASSLRLRDGWYVAWSWHEGSGKATPPDVVPTPHEAPADTTGPTTKPSSKPNGNGDGDGNGNGGTRGGEDGGGSSDTAPSSTATTGDPTPSATSTEDGDRGDRSDRGEGTGRKSGKRNGKQDQDGSAGKRTDPAASSTPSDLPQIDEITEGPPGAADEDAAGGMSTATIAAIGVGVLVLGAAGAVPLLRRRRG